MENGKIDMRISCRSPVASHQLNSTSADSYLHAADTNYSYCAKLNLTCTPKRVVALLNDVEITGSLMLRSKYICRFSF